MPESNTYDITVCPKCGEPMFNGECENPDCIYHYLPLDFDESSGDEKV